LGTSHSESIRNPINRGLFETETVALARLSSDALEYLRLRSNLVIQKFAQRYSTDIDFNSALLSATGRGRASNKRMEVIESIFREVLNA
jgi:hypothetical protein